MFLDLEEFPILDHVARSRRRVKILFTEQELFAIAALLSVSRDRVSDPVSADHCQVFINRICERLDQLNHGFLASLIIAQQITIDEQRDFARQVAERMQKRDRQNQHRKPSIQP